MANKYDSLKRSNLAHVKLKNKFSKSTSDYDNYVKTNYHSICADTQSKLGRILTRHEKERIYRNTEFYFFN